MMVTIGLDSSDQPQDIADYIKNGADEFFVGFVPSQWYNCYGWEIGLNRRNFGPENQFTSYEELEKIVTAVHKQKKKIFIVLNAHQYIEEQVPLIKEVVSMVEKCNPDGYIVADLALILLLRKWGINRPFQLSTGVGCFNSETIHYFARKVGISRVVIPRKMSLKEMKQLIEKCGDLDIKFEVMIIHYRCFLMMSTVSAGIQVKDLIFVIILSTKKK